MAGQRRRLGKERHTALKLVLSVIAVAGFGVAWVALDAGHDPRPAGSTTAPELTPDAQTTPGAGPDATATRRPRMSRGS